MTPPPAANLAHNLRDTSALMDELRGALDGRSRAVCLPALIALYLELATHDPASLRGAAASLGYAVDRINTAAGIELGGPATPQ